MFGIKLKWWGLGAVGVAGAVATHYVYTHTASPWFIEHTGTEEDLEKRLEKYTMIPYIIKNRDPLDKSTIILRSKGEDMLLELCGSGGTVWTSKSPEISLTVSGIFKTDKTPTITLTTPSGVREHTIHSWRLVSSKLGIISLQVASGTPLVQFEYIDKNTAKVLISIGDSTLAKPIILTRSGYKDPDTSNNPTLEID
jgi:hypothetical protein